MKEIKLLVLEERENEGQDSSEFLKNWHSRTTTFFTQRKSTLRNTSHSTKKCTGKSGNGKSCSQSQRNVSWTIEKTSELTAFLWHFRNIKIPTQGTKSVKNWIQSSSTFKRNCRLKRRWKKNLPCSYGFWISG